MQETEKLTAGEALTWWMKNRKWVIPTAVGIFAVLGGNADRLDKWLPALGDNTALVGRVTKLESAVETLVKAVDAHEEQLSKKPTTTEQPAFRE
jgi:membrane protein required for beta-lactamase induction